MLLLDIMLVATTTAIACSSLGLFLVLKGVALMSDAISHTVIFGIVSAYLLFKTFNSTILALGAMCTGIITVWLTEILISTEKIYKEVAVGLVFPLLFSLGTLLICQYTASLHLDVDMVLLGEITLASLKRIIISGVDYGPSSFWFMTAIMLLNVSFIACFYRSLQLCIFDPNTANLYNMHPKIIYYGLIVLVSLTIVSALEVVGSLVAVALMIIPAATALLSTDVTIKNILMITVQYAAFATIVGCVIGFYFDVSIGGCIAIVLGICFFGTFLRTKTEAHFFRKPSSFLPFSKK
ncbi:metal ABC transporter permease [Candidatus Dependentiae bacterium]|nr:MAG: metal ABC transporter permease [Candidatus Dependentiae bacterium]